MSTATILKKLITLINFLTCGDLKMLINILRGFIPRFFARSSTTSFILIGLVTLTLLACTERTPNGNIKNIQATNSIEDVAETNIVNRVISGDPLPVNVSFDPEKYKSADFVKGGLLYDSWFSVNNISSPVTINPIWNLLEQSKIDKADTWRCSSCHGWDYLGVNGIFGDINNVFYSGINGIVPANKQLTEPQIWTFIRDGYVRNNNNIRADHTFSKQLTDDDIYALTKFIINVRNENSAQVSPLTVNNNKANLNANQTLGANLYNASAVNACSSCHGTSGQAIKPVNVQQAAAADPAKTLHRVRFGIASVTNPMPGLLTTLTQNQKLSLQYAGDITLFAANGLHANHIKGGRLFDDWTVESGIDVTTLAVNPLWQLAPYPEFIPVGADTDPVESWRCVNCHNYYYEGGNGFEFNDLLVLKEDRGWTLDNAPDSFTYLFNFLTNGFLANLNGVITRMHDYGQFVSADPTLTPGLQSSDLWDLADFLVEETMATDRYILPDIGTASGGPGRPADYSIGLEYYTGINQLLGTDQINCSMCHGLDGLGVPTVDLATLAWDDPWMFFHRARFGTPRPPGSVLAPPFDTTATIMPGVLELTKQDGIIMSDNDDPMHVLLYIQLALNGFTLP